MINVHKDALEGTVFYNGWENKAPYVTKYFPPNTGEVQLAYKQRPKISITITAGIINRLLGILCSNYIIEGQNPDSVAALALLEEQGLYEKLRDSMSNVIVTGANLTTYNADTGAIQNWDNSYIENMDGSRGIIAIVKDGKYEPVLTPDDLKNKNLMRWYDPYTTYAQNIDTYSGGKYGRPFVKRFVEMAQEYNLIFSQCSKAIKILQNVWVTNLDMENPDAILSLAPDKINFLGEKGSLEQAVRNLDLTEEWNYLAVLEQKISNASQVPAELSGLRDAGKIPSGVALSILLQPLKELVNRFKPIFRAMTLDTIEKASGLLIPNPQFTFTRTETDLLPRTKEERLADIVTLKGLGVLPGERIAELVEDWLNG